MMAKKSEAAAKVAEVIEVAAGKSIGFRAGIKVTGDIVDPNWPEFKANSKLLDEMLKNGLLVKKSESAE